MSHSSRSPFRPGSMMAPQSLLSSAPSRHRCTHLSLIIMGTTGTILRPSTSTSRRDPLSLSRDAHKAPVPTGPLSLTRMALRLTFMTHELSQGLAPCTQLVITSNLSASTAFATKKETIVSPALASLSSFPPTKSPDQPSLCVN